VPPRRVRGREGETNGDGPPQIPRRTSLVHRCPSDTRSWFGAKIAKRWGWYEGP